MTAVQKAQADYPYLTLDEIRSLSKEIRGVMVEKGWYETERTREEVGMLIASEVFEAFEDYRDGKMDTYFTDAGKPCGCWSELADVAIRCLDAMDDVIDQLDVCFSDGIEEYERALHGVEMEFNGISTVSMMAELARICTDWDTEYNYEFFSILIRAVSVCEVMLRNFSNTNLRHEIQLKMTYNRTRPHRHGGKKL